jgi:hypothetical protein
MQQVSTLYGCVCPQVSRECLTSYRQAVCIVAARVCCSQGVSPYTPSKSVPSCALEHAPMQCPCLQ